MTSKPSLFQHHKDGIQQMLEDFYPSSPEEEDEIEKLLEDELNNLLEEHAETHVPNKDAAQKSKGKTKNKTVLTAGKTSESCNANGSNQPHCVDWNITSSCYSSMPYENEGHSHQTFVSSSSLAHTMPMSSMNSNSHCCSGESRKKRVYTPLSRHLLLHKAALVSDVSTPHATVHNMVSTSKIVCIPPGNVAKLNEEDEDIFLAPACIDLDRIYSLIPCSHYNRKKFAAITIRISSPTVTALLFTSGRLVITGSKSWYECVLASLVIVRMLNTAQPECHFHVQDCEIQNVVANVIIPASVPEIPKSARLNINAMLVHLNEEGRQVVCQYRKFLFPGLVYRPPNSPVVVLCFSSGKCVVTGGKNTDDVDLGWAVLWQTIRRFVVDQDGRAFLTNNEILHPMLPSL
jgi:transcription initiation factor TFIID TATA-box-binding protein